MPSSGGWRPGSKPCVSEAQGGSREGVVSILGFRTPDTPGVGFRMFHVPFGTFAHF